MMFQKPATGSLESLLEKYENEGVFSIEEGSVLNVVPLSQMGSPVELVRAFGKNADFQDIWLVALHANRVPPHIGLMINGTYNSLTIKGHELNVSSEALLKTISQKKIESIFIKLKKNPVFSYDHQLEMLQEMISKFENVRQYEATCLSPLKLFFEHFYAITYIEEELYFDLMKRMNEMSILNLQVPAILIFIMDF